MALKAKLGKLDVIPWVMGLPQRPPGQGRAQLDLSVHICSYLTSWQIDGDTMETMTDFIFLGSKITAIGGCSHEIKRYLAPWRKSYEKLRQCIKKQRHHFANKGPFSQSMVFPRVIYRCES